MSAIASSTPAGLVRVDYEGDNNTLQTLFLRIGQRVRVEIESTATPVASGASSPTSASPLPPAAPEATTAKATVKYIGPVAAARDATAIMIGIEWDESSRGKNDGSVGGVRYFTTNAVKGGSF